MILPRRTQRTDEANAYRALYKTKAWAHLRLFVFQRDGYICQKTGRLLGGKRNAPDSPVAHHVVPHRGDRDLFLDARNVITVSKEWHDRTAQSEEARGFSTEVGSDGWPSDPRHPANA